MDRRGMERNHRPVRLWRHGFAGASQHRLHRNLERGEYGVQPLPAADAGRDRGYAIARNRSLESPLSRQARVRRMDRHHEFDGAAGGFRLGRAQDKSRAPAGWHIQTLWLQDFHHLRRARYDGKYRALRACPFARCAQRNARHLALSRAEISCQRRWHAWRTQRRLLHLAGAQARYPCLAHMHHGLWRSWRCDWVFWSARRTRVLPACSP